MNPPPALSLRPSRSLVPSSPAQVPDEELTCESTGTGPLICEGKPAEEPVKIEEEAVPKEEDAPYIIEDEESIKNRARLIEDLEKVLRRLGIIDGPYREGR